MKMTTKNFDYRRFKPMNNSTARLKSIHLFNDKFGIEDSNFI